MSPLPAARCAWCAKDQPRNAEAHLEGLAGTDWTGSAIVARAVSTAGVRETEWIVDDLDGLAALTGSTIVGDEGGALLLDPQAEPDWLTVCYEVGTALSSARTAERLALGGAAVAAVHAADAGAPETKIAEALGVDRMTVRKWLGKR